MTVTIAPSTHCKYRGALQVEACCMDFCLTLEVGAHRVSGPPLGEIWRLVSKTPSQITFVLILLVELARLYTCRLQKSLDLSANQLPFLVMRVAYPISASRLSSQFARVGSRTHIPFLVIYIDYLISVRFLPVPRVGHNSGLLDFKYSGNTKI